MRNGVMIVLCLVSFLTCAQDQVYLKVHFLYGSRPLKKYKDSEKKWFGGVLGGHVGIEGDSNRIIDFVPRGRFHWFAKDQNRHGAFVERSVEGFYEVFGGDPNCKKAATVRIPITREQKMKFDSLAGAYCREAPYDYAFIGMRCGAAAYDILSRLEILPKYGYSKTYRKIFYPRKLRKRLFRKASENNWTIVRREGSETRRWEKD